MEEKKKIKVSLGTTICIFIIIILIATIIGMYLFYNKKQETTSETTNNVTQNINEKVNQVSENQSIENKANITTTSNNKYSFNEGTYALTLDTDDSILYNLHEVTKNPVAISFASNEFIIYLDENTVKGTYEMLDENNLKCYISSYTYNNNAHKQTTSLEQNNWTIDFNVEDNNKIETKKCDVGDGSEISIILSNILVNLRKFIKYEESDFIGKWTSKYAITYDNIDSKPEREELNLILGSAVHTNGSNFTFNKNNTFDDYVHPITEGDKYRNGTYTFDGINTFTLKYPDNEERETKIYIINGSTIAYDTGYAFIILSK